MNFFKTFIFAIIGVSIFFLGISTPFGEQHDYVWQNAFLAFFGITFASLILLFSEQPIMFSNKPNPTEVSHD